MTDFKERDSGLLVPAKKPEPDLPEDWTRENADRALLVMLPHEEIRNLLLDSFRWRGRWNMLRDRDTTTAEATIHKICDIIQRETGLEFEQYT